MKISCLNISNPKLDRLANDFGEIKTSELMDKYYPNSIPTYEEFISNKFIKEELGITSNKDFLNPEKSAIATASILAIRYHEQLTPTQKKDIETYLPTKWNNRSNYSSRVKTNSQYLKIKELN